MVDVLFACARLDMRGPRLPPGEPLLYGAATIGVPIHHEIGRFERPRQLHLWRLTLGEQEDPEKHFVFAHQPETMPEDVWLRVVMSSGASNALIYVHGFNSLFDNALLQLGQILWDVQSTAIPIAFCWASAGQPQQYAYDRESAAVAVPHFRKLLSKLALIPTLRDIHILAHSMGNQVVIDALAQVGVTAERSIVGELLMAAPDVDRDVFMSRAGDVRKAVRGMTLYASSADKALKMSKIMAGGVPRAGDVPTDGPLFHQAMDTIDVTKVGEDMLGINHSVYSSDRLVLNDIGLVIKNGLRPPHARLPTLRAMPPGTTPPRYWQV
jgi:esterase/lipase superfamily enzyme